MLPFTAQQFFDVFERYNSDLPFAVIVLTLLAVAVVAFAFTDSGKLGRIPVFILAFLWLWAGAVYHIGYFAELNPAAYLFGGAFLLQAAAFAIVGSRNAGMPLEFHNDIYGYVGAVLIFYALVIYPLTGYLAGHIFPRTPTFGLPCPLTIFTFGALLWSRRKVPFYLLVIPVIWTLIGTSAAVLFGVWQDIALLVAGAAGTTLILCRKGQ